MPIIFYRRSRLTDWMQLFIGAPVTLFLGVLCLANEFWGFGTLFVVSSIWVGWDRWRSLRARKAARALAQTQKSPTPGPRPPAR